MSHPCTVEPSFCQEMLFTSPHRGFRSTLTLVNFSHLPSGPVHTSGGCDQDARIVAVWRLSAENDTPASREAFNVSSPFHNISVEPLFRSNVFRTVLPPATAVKTMR